MGVLGRPRVPDGARPGLDAARVFIRRGGSGDVGDGEDRAIRAATERRPRREALRQELVRGSHGGPRPSVFERQVESDEPECR
jgi:hypothetical protein